MQHLVLQCTSEQTEEIKGALSQETLPVDPQEGMYSIISIMSLLLLLTVWSSHAVSIERLQSSAESDIEKRQTSSGILCTTGPKALNASATFRFRAQQGRVYFDLDHPLTCAGRVHRIEMCFEINNDLPGGASIDLVLLRPNGDLYNVERMQDVEINNIQQNDNVMTTNILYCQNITVPDGFSVAEGDVIGFRTKNSVEIVFTTFPEDRSVQSLIILPVLGIETVSRNQLLENSQNENELPMFRVSIVDDGSSNEPTTSRPADCPTSGNDGGGGGGGEPSGGPDLNFDNIYNTTLTSFVIATVVAIVIIFFLLLILCGMGMSLCKEKFKCLYKVCCCSCRKKKKKGIIRKMIPV